MTGPSQPLISLLPTTGVAGIDTSGFARSHASKHCTKRAKPAIQQLNVTLFVDTRANTIRDPHVTTTRKHDTQIAPSLLNRNAAEVEVLLGNKGYDDQQIRSMARNNDSRPLVKHREFSSLQKVWNARLDTKRYDQRSQNETVNYRYKHSILDFVSFRAWFRLFRESVLGASVPTKRSVKP